MMTKKKQKKNNTKIFNHNLPNGNYIQNKTKQKKNLKLKIWREKRLCSERISLMCYI